MSTGAPTPLPEIRTERLVLEPLLAAHAPAMFEVLRDPVIHRYCG